MTSFRQKLSARFEAWGTRFSNNLHRHSLSEAKWQLALLFFVIGVIIFLALGLLVDVQVRKAFYEVALHQADEPIDKEYANLRRILWTGRALRLILYAFTAYLLAELAMRPLRKSVELQRHFVATASHQFKTPLAVMKTTLEVALRKKEALTLERARAAMEDTLIEVERLTSIITFLLRFARFENGARSLSFAEVSLRDVAKEASNEVRWIADERGIEVRLVENTAGMIRGDAVALRELLANLLSNALRYTPRDGTITVTVAEAPKQCIELSVADTGAGIASEELPRLFEAFYQGAAKPAHAGIQGNVGLGLYMVREIAHLHRASIQVESSMRGAKFLLLFPRTRSR